MNYVFIDLAIILFSAFLISYILKILNQPIIVGYIIAGILVSPFLIGLQGSLEIINIFSEFGVAFLLFIVGLHLNPKVIKEIGGSSLFIGLGQITITFLITFVISKFALGFNSITSIYFGIALSFSSTIIIMKLISDKKQLDSLYGKISTGILIIQDLVAIGVLIFLSSFGKEVQNNLVGIKWFIAGFILIGFLFLTGYFILPKVIKKIAKSQELLFLFSICWCFVLVALFSYLGFSMEIGALVAGIILSSSPFATEISSKVRPLRDFFLIIFFIILGLKIKISDLDLIILDSIVLSAIAILIKPLILMLFSKYHGFTKRTNFLVGSTLAQISEFSLIILGVGVLYGHILPEALNTGVLAMVITLFVSSYMIIYSSKIYDFISPSLGFFERKRVKNLEEDLENYDSILFGYNRIGFSILNSLKKLKRKYLVVDFNPDTILKLNNFRIPSLYGDVQDLEFLDELPLEKINIAVSTIPDLDTNILLIDEIRKRNDRAIIIVRAHAIDDALKLYQGGASYVLTPHFLGGEYVAKMIKHSGLKNEEYEQERKKHIKMLNEIKDQGHKHPEVEKD